MKTWPKQCHHLRLNLIILVEEITYIMFNNKTGPETRVKQEMKALPLHRRYHTSAGLTGLA